MLFLPPSDGHDASSLAVVWIEVILSTIMVPCRRLSRPRPCNCYDGWVVLVCNPDVGDAFHYLAVCDPLTRSMNECKPCLEYSAEPKGV
jgi:hypothetical protein